MPTEASARLSAKWLTQSRRTRKPSSRVRPPGCAFPPSSVRARPLLRSGPYTASVRRCTATRTPEQTGSRRVAGASSPWGLPRSGSSGLRATTTLSLAFF
eukprot:1037300-Alexandrium_andersonii.AAC.1